MGTPPVSDGPRVGLLFGGRSVEHEVSVVSARGVAAAMASTSLRLVPIAVTESGQWLDPERSREILESDAARAETGTGDDGSRVLLDTGGGGLMRARAGARLQPLEIDALFPLVHGWGGEDGRLQGALELAGIPYVGAGVLGSSLGMDKAAAKRVFEACGLPVVPWTEVRECDYAADAGAEQRRVVDLLEPPWFVKPANGGSSVGISRVLAAAGLGRALEKALEHDRKVVVERGVDAREIECAMLGNDKPEASGLGEIVPSREFYDYAAKYVDGTSELRIPASLDETWTERLRAASLDAFRALDLCGMARVDFLLRRDGGAFFVNEVNTLPGFTPISMYPKLWEAAGLSYPDLIERLVELGRRQATRRAGLRSRRAG